MVTQRKVQKRDEVTDPSRRRLLATYDKVMDSILVPGEHYDPQLPGDDPANFRRADTPLGGFWTSIRDPMARYD